MPVPAAAHVVNLLFHEVDIPQRPRSWVHSMLDGCVFSGQAEGVPADGVQDVVALHVLEASQDIGDGVDSQMAKM